MSQDRSRNSGENDDGISTNAYNVFVRMEQLNERLKLLKYEKEFCRSKHQKPLPRHYYALPTNPGEQFPSFTSLAAWLIGKTGGKIEPPQEYDDPNATIATILDAVRQLGHSVEFAPSKLKSGCGEHCVDVLLMLADSALKIQAHKYTLPEYPEETQDDINTGEFERSFATDDEELTEWQGNANTGGFVDNDIGKLLNGADSDEDAPDLDALQRRGSQFNRTTATGDNELDESDKIISPTAILQDAKFTPEVGAVLESTTDPSDWQLEVERVLPQLRVTIRTDAKDWRAHLEDMHKHQQEIDNAYDFSKAFLTRLHGDLNRALEKVHSREKYINSQVEPLLAQYKNVQDSLTEATAKYRAASGGITQRSSVLAELSDELERVKNEMDERGSSMTDGSPVVRIKQAIQRLRSEMVGMDIRTGVLEHILLRAQLQQREANQKPLFGKSGGHDNDNPAFVY